MNFGHVAIVAFVSSPSYPVFMYLHSTYVSMSWKVGALFTTW